MNQSVIRRRRRVENPTRRQFDLSGKGQTACAASRLTVTEGLLPTLFVSPGR